MQPRLVRFSLAFVAACVVALLLFALMLSMVNPPRSKIQEDPLAIANFVRMDGRNEDSATRTRQQAPQPPQPKTPQPPTPPTPNMATPDANLPKLDLDLPSIDAGISVATAPAPSLSGLTAAQSAPAPAAAPAPASAAVEAAGKPGGPEQEVMPLNDVRPEYPYRARQQGLEGHIKLAFTINPQGRVENIRVLEASPRNVFDREARRAAARWRFAPRTENGAPVSREAVKTLHFRLQGER
ncbi:MAG: energy transducer TonB [Pseudomonas stutzeri]|jgi:periplasmic protein TonB|uniref:energy transducer TonB n=1 Tax=Stutzerimonas stutzeri TaxID=316 RepID=UPI0002D54C41|nr:energy transducer TonB [Stutzerimonas stutzeri]MBO0643374.1 energy transducer TonB [Stutzerimonas stutzeri]MDH0118766.1 energy transducer TonB [Stutzerimonas stutzeri]MTI91590.1 energy transducer TonB [Stutzerimonas stutzeri]OCX56743.1 energy transducer TonB [Stutzerimonas stutzeri]